MAGTHDMQDGKNYHLDVPQTCSAFPLKGSNSLDWGMKNRLSRIFSRDDCRTVMLAVDHGYFQGPTTGLERIDITITPLIPFADALMITRGALRSSIPPEMNKPVVLRSSGGQSILKELSNERIAVDIEDAIRLNASALAVQVYIGGVHEHESIGNLVEIVDGQSPRHSHHGRYRSGQGIGTRRQVPGPRHPYLRGARRSLCEDVLLRTGLCTRGRRLSRPVSYRRRKETARARCARDGVPRDE